MMKKRIIIFFSGILMISTIFMYKMATTSAHPGRKDSSGCHYCRTNCASYGLSTNEYHCHNGGGSSSGGGASAPTVTPIQPSAAEIEAQQRAAEAARQEQERILVEAQTKQAEMDGYDFKQTNPNASLPDLSGQPEHYISAYKAAFDKAEQELSTKSKEIAEENARKDAISLEEMNLTVPEKVIEVIYLTEYKDMFEQFESKHLETIILDAKAKAKVAVFNFVSANDKNDYILKKEKDIYCKYYKEAYIDYEQQLAETKEEIIARAKDDAGSKKDIAFLDEYEDYKVYDSLVKLYNKTYEENDNSIGNIISLGIALIFGAGLISWFIVFLKRRNTLFKKENNLE